MPARATAEAGRSATEFPRTSAAAPGHEYRLPPPRPSARHVIKQETFAETHGNGREAQLVARVSPDPDHGNPTGIGPDIDASFETAASRPPQDEEFSAYHQKLTSS
jgi:hypothetical protein